jgi:hypothetical protein
MKFPLIFAPQKVIEDFLFFRISFHYCMEILEDIFWQEQQTMGYIYGKGAF